MFELMSMTFVVMFSQTTIYKKEIAAEKHREDLMMRIEELMQKQKELDKRYNRNTNGIYVIPEIRPRSDTQKNIDK